MVKRSLPLKYPWVKLDGAAAGVLAKISVPLVFEIIYLPCAFGSQRREGVRGEGVSKGMPALCQRQIEFFPLNPSRPISLLYCPRQPCLDPCHLTAAQTAAFPNWFPLLWSVPCNSSHGTGIFLKYRCYHIPFHASPLSSPPQKPA